MIDIDDMIRRSSEVLPDRPSRAKIFNQTRSRNKRLVALELSKFVVSELKFRIVGPTYKAIASEFEMKYFEAREYFKRAPLENIFQSNMNLGVVPQMTEQTYTYLKNISPNTTMLRWSTTDLDSIIGPKGIINLYFLEPDEVKEVLENYARRKYGLGSK